MNFFVFYFLPVSIAAWYVGKNASLLIGVLSALSWFGSDILSGHSHSLHFYAVWNTLIRLVAFVTIGILLYKIRQLLEDQRRLSEDLQQSISEIKVLETFLPICCQCKKIKDQEGNWQQMEEYISNHTNTLFSHGYCPECYKKIMAEAGLTEK